MNARTMRRHISIHTAREAARLILLAGCALAPSLALSGMDVVSYAGTDRSVAGNAASAMSAEDCGAAHLIRSNARGAGLSPRTGEE
jgi:hypothetical protein